MMIRAATAADREFLAWSILAATRSHLDRGWFDISLNRPEADCLKFLQLLTATASRSPWHHSRFTIAGEIDGEPAACVCAVPAPEGYKDAGIALLQSLKSFGLNQAEIAAFWKRGAYLFTCAPTPGKSTLVVEVAATKPTRRNQGHLAALLAHTIENARSQGFEKVETSCFIGNAAAERAYERTGFTCVGETCHPDFAAVTGVPGIRRFVTDLCTNSSKFASGSL